MTLDSTIPLPPRTPSRATLARARSALRCTPLALALACATDAGGEAFAHDAAVASTVWTVTNCNDAGPGSLREAFSSAGDGDLVDLTGLTCGSITLTTGELVNDVPRLFTVRGPHDENYNPTLTISGGHASRVFHMTAGGLELENLIVTAGRASSSGGCIAAEYAVHLDHSILSDCAVADSGTDSGGGCIATHVGVELASSTLSGCSVSTTGAAKARGGAIFSDGYYVNVYGSTIADSTAHAASADSGGGAIWSSTKVLLFGSTISGNTASGDGSHYARGGGVYANDFMSDNSLIAGNRADTGGGVFASDGSYNYNTVRIDNSTISGNEANAWAGGLMVAVAPMSLSIGNSTITANRVPGGSFGGVWLAGAATVDSTIIAGNSVSDGLQESDLGGAAGATITGARNLIRASSLPVPGDTITSDPKLGPLQDNGGQTWTHALLAGSPAIDHGSSVDGNLVDQRLNDGHGHFFPRIVGSSADIGAFEYGADAIFTDGFEPPIPIT